MLELLGVLVGLCLLVAVAYYFMFGGKEKLARYLFVKMSLEGKVEKIIKTDFSSEYARCKFYINNNYKRGYTQTEWQEYYQQQVDNTLDKNSQEYAEAIAPILNAIVLDKEGYYMRRGMEDMSKKLERLRIGENDHISLNYFIEPYKYTKHKQSQEIKDHYANLSPTEYCNPVTYKETSSTRNWQEEKARAKAERREALRATDDRLRAENEAFHQRMAEQKEALKQDRATRAAGIAKCANCANNRRCSSGIKESGAGLTCGGYTPK